LTLWLHGFQALGIPGANHAGLLAAGHLQSIPRVYVIHEPDEGGAAFVKGVRRQLFSIGFAGSLLEIKMPGRHKDPNEMHCSDPAEFEGLFRAALKDATFQRLGDVDLTPEWEPPAQLHDPDLPAFPADSLPDWLLRFVEAEAVATQTPLDMGAMLALAALACACAKKVEIQVKPDYCEPLNIFTIVALPPGNRKSTVFSEVTSPIREFERAEVLRLAPEIAVSRTRAQIEEAQLKQLQERAAKGSPAERDSAKDDAEQQAMKVAGMKTPSEPCLIVDDCTPERLAGRLSEQGGRIAILSPEADVFELMAGRYSSNGAPNLGVYLKGHAGDSIRVDRIGRATQHVEKPALTLGLAVQPSALQGLTKRPGFQGRGLLGRFLYALPRSPLGTRSIDVPSVPISVRQEYCDRLTTLLKLPVPEPGSPPHTILPDGFGQSAFREFEAWIEPQLGEFGELGYMQDWGGKLLGAVARIAGLLHMAEHSEKPAPWTHRVTGQTAKAAMRIGYYLIAHAKVAYAEMGADPVLEDAKYILRWMKSRELETFTRRDLHQATRGRFKKVEALEPGLSLLVSHGYIRQQAYDEKGRPGRRQSIGYAVNPLWVERSPQNAQNARLCTPREDFECSEQTSLPPDYPTQHGPLGDADEVVI
jgi:hypothetical protein